MDFPSETLHFIVCPQCKGDLRYTKEKVLLCANCRLCFSIENGEANLSLEAALPLTEDGKIVPRGTFASFVVLTGIDKNIHFRLEKGTCRAIGRQLEDSVQTQIFNADFTMSLDDHTKKLIQGYLQWSKKQKKDVEKDTDESPVWATNRTRQHNRAAGEVLAASRGTARAFARNGSQSDCRPNHGPVSKKPLNYGGKSDFGAYKRLPDIILSDLGVSRLHAMVFYDESGVGILDLVSHNGTFVNDDEVEISQLSPGDRVRIGNTLIEYSEKCS